MNPDSSSPRRQPRRKTSRPERATSRATGSAPRAPRREPRAESPDWSQAVLTFMRKLFAQQVQRWRKTGEGGSVSGEPSSTQAPPVAVPSAGSEARPTQAALLGISSGQLKRMRHQLSAVLDLHSSTRSVFPHLNYLDKALRRQGADCFRDLPVEVLHKALRQLDALVQSPRPGPVGLAELRACLVVSAVDRGAPDTEADTLIDLPGGEAQSSDFMQEPQKWSSMDPTVKLAKS